MQRVEMLKRIQQLEKELKSDVETESLELIQELANTRVGVPTIFLKQYDRLKKKLKNPIVRLINGVCQGCFISSSMGMAIVAKANKGIYICENCGRLVYVDKEEETEEKIEKK